MRTRTALQVALLAFSLPVALSAQVVRGPRVGRRPTPPPAPLPPTGGPVAQTLQYHRARWTGGSYGMVSGVRVPSAYGMQTYGGFGTGVQGGYRFGDRFLGTADLTTSLFGSPMQFQTGEVGGRFLAMPFGEQVRPFVDLRAAYVHLSDTYEIPGNQFGFNEVTRYARGFGGITGAGFEYSLTNSFAFMTEFAALRARMTAYRSSTPTAIPDRTGYWMTSYRLAFGLRYNPTRTTSLKQNPH